MFSTFDMASQLQKKTASLNFLHMMLYTDLGSGQKNEKNILKNFVKCRNLAFGIGEQFRKMITPLRWAIHNKQKF